MRLSLSDLYLLSNLPALRAGPFFRALTGAMIFVVTNGTGVGKSAIINCAITGSLKSVTIPYGVGEITTFFILTGIPALILVNCLSITP